MILEPADFGNEYAVAPVCDRRTSDGKLMWKTFIEENEGKTIVSADDAAVIQAFTLHGLQSEPRLPHPRNIPG